MKDNYYILLIAILENYNPDEAAQIFYSGRLLRTPENERKRIICLRNKGLTYQQIADLTGSKKATIWARLNRLPKK